MPDDNLINEIKNKEDFKKVNTLLDTIYQKCYKNDETIIKKIVELEGLFNEITILKQNINEKNEKLIICLDKNFEIDTCKENLKEIIKNMKDYLLKIEEYKGKFEEKKNDAEKNFNLKKNTINQTINVLKEKVNKLNEINQGTGKKIPFNQNEKNKLNNEFNKIKNLLQELKKLKSKFDFEDISNIETEIHNLEDRIKKYKEDTEEPTEEHNEENTGNNAAKNNLTPEDEVKYRAIFLEGDVNEGTFKEINETINDDNICKIVKFLDNEEKNFNFYKNYRNRFFGADTEQDIKINYNILRKNYYPTKFTAIKKKNIIDCYRNFFQQAKYFKEGKKN